MLTLNTQRLHLQQDSPLRSLASGGSSGSLLACWTGGKAPLLHICETSPDLATVARLSVPTDVSTNIKKVDTVNDDLTKKNTSDNLDHSISKGSGFVSVQWRESLSAMSSECGGLLALCSSHQAVICVLISSRASSDLLSAAKAVEKAIEDSSKRDSLKVKDGTSSSWMDWIFRAEEDASLLKEGAGNVGSSTLVNTTVSKLATSFLEEDEDLYTRRHRGKSDGNDDMLNSGAGAISSSNATQENSLVTWHVAAAAFIRTEESGPTFTAATCSRAGLILGKSDGRILLVRWNNGEVIYELDAHGAAINLLSSSSSNSSRGVQSPAAVVALSACGDEVVVCAFADGLIVSFVTTVSGHRTRVPSESFSLLINTSHQQQHQAPMPTPTSICCSFAPISHGGLIAAVGYSDGTVSIFLSSTVPSSTSSSSDRLSKHPKSPRHLSYMTVTTTPTIISRKWELILSVPASDAGDSAGPLQGMSPSLSSNTSSSSIFPVLAMSFRSNISERRNDATLAVLVASSSSSSSSMTPPLLSVWSFPCVREDAYASLLHASWLSSNSNIESKYDANRLPKQGSVAWLRGGFSVVASASFDSDSDSNTLGTTKTAQLEMTDFADAALGKSGSLNAADDANGAQWCLSRDSIHTLMIHSNASSSSTSTIERDQRDFSELPISPKKANILSPTASALSTATAPNEIGDVSVTWRSIPLSPYYMPLRAPLRLLCASRDGVHVAVAGSRGLSVLSMLKRPSDNLLIDKWHVFSRRSEEAKINAKALTWLMDKVLLVLHEEEDGFRIQAFWPTHLDFNSSLINENLPLPEGHDTVLAMATGQTLVEGDDKTTTASIIPWFVVASKSSKNLVQNDERNSQSDDILLSIFRISCSKFEKERNTTTLSGFSTSSTSSSSSSSTIAVSTEESSSSSSSSSSSFSSPGVIDASSSSQLSLWPSNSSASIPIAFTTPLEVIKNSSLSTVSDVKINAEGVVSLTRKDFTLRTEEMSLQLVTVLSLSSNIPSTEIAKENDDDSFANKRKTSSLQPGDALSSIAILESKCEITMGVSLASQTKTKDLTYSTTETGSETSITTETTTAKQATPTKNKKSAQRSILSTSTIPALWYPFLPELALRTASGRVLIVDLRSRVSKSLECDNILQSSSMSLVPASAYGLGGGDLLVSTYPNKITFYAPSPTRLRLSVDAITASSISFDSTFLQIKKLFSSSLISNDGAIMSSTQHVVSLSSAANTVVGVLPRDGGCAVIIASSSRISETKSSTSQTESRIQNHTTIPAPSGITLLPLLPSVLRACLEAPSYTNSSTCLRDVFVASALRKMFSNSTPFVRAGLRAFLHDAIDDEHRIAASAHQNVTLARKFPIGSNNTNDKNTLVDVLSGCSPAAALAIRALAGALRVYLPTRGISLAALSALVEPDGNKLHTDALPPFRLSNKNKIIDILGDGITASDLDIQEGLAQSTEPPLLFPARSFRLSDALSLLRRTSAYAFLDTVSAVGRTLEEEQLPLLVPAAGNPRALFDSCLQCAKVAAGDGRHTINSLRYLQAASATLLLTHIVTVVLNPKESINKKTNTDSLNQGESIIELATSLLSAFGCPNPLNEKLVLEIISADAPLQPLSRSDSSLNGDLETRLRSALFLQCEPATAASVVLALLQLAEGIRAYCHKVRSSSSSSASSSSSNILASASHSLSSNTKMTGGIITGPMNPPMSKSSSNSSSSTSGGGLWGFVVTIASFIGLSNSSENSSTQSSNNGSNSSDITPQSPLSPFSSVSVNNTQTTNSTQSTTQVLATSAIKNYTLLPLAAGITAAKADPVVQHLLVTLIPLLAHISTTINSGSYPILLAPYSTSRQASLAAEIAAASAGVVATSSRPGNTASVDLKAVQLATADLAASQAKWIHAQTRGLSSSLQEGQIATIGLQIGDAIAKVDSFACYNASLDAVRQEMSKTNNKTNTIDVLRVVTMPVLRVLIAILNNE